MAKLGRKTLLTPERMEAICEAIEVGASIPHAAQAVGIAHRTLYDWAERGRAEQTRIDMGLEPNENETPFLHFLQALEKAEGHFIVSSMKRINTAAESGTWTADAWRLERRFPKQYGRQDRTEITGEGGGPVQFTVSTEELERKIAKVLAKRSEIGE